MEFLLIGESKLKIVLSEEESKKYNINTALPDGGGAGVRRAFWRILDMAREEVGFDPKGDKILIQFYPLRTGGCEVFVTKLGILPESSARLVSKSNRISLLSKNRSYYAFDSVDDLLTAVRAIKMAAGEISLNSDIYFDNDKYYLSIEEYGRGGEPIEFPCILEFSRGLTDDFGIFISEHATCLIGGNAIDVFSKL